MKCVQIIPFKLILFGSLSQNFNTEWPLIIHLNIQTVDYRISVSSYWIVLTPLLQQQANLVNCLK